MILFGITGGIASGKSFFTATLREAGIPIVDADQVAREVVEPGTKGCEELLQAFGEKFFSNGRLNRSLLRDLVFNDKKAMETLNAITHPLISERSFEIVTELSQSNSIVGYDSALLIETGSYKNYKPLIVIYCPIEVQIERLMKRNNVSEELARTIIGCQMLGSEKIKYADYVVDSSGSKEDGKKQALFILNELFKLRNGS